MVLEQLIKQEKIEATQEDLDARIGACERAKSPEELKDMGEDTLHLKNEIVMEKAFPCSRQTPILE